VAKDDRLKLWRRFTPLEDRLLAAVRIVLPPAAQSVFDSQVAAINRVQRLPPSWSEIDFYCLRRGRTDWSRVPAFRCTDEFRLAEVRFQVGGAAYRAVLSCIAGHIFDLAITPGPKAIAFANWDGTPRIKLFADPDQAPTGRREAESLPPEWREFLSRTAGALPRGWALYDAATARRVTLVDSEYLILAERDSEDFVLYRLEPPGGGFFRLRGYDAEPEPMGEGLDQVFQKGDA
jgi:hypothetical protein